MSLLLRVEDVVRETTLSESTVWRLVAAGRFPRPLDLGGRVRRWRRAEIEAWVNADQPSRDKWHWTPPEPAPEPAPARKGRRKVGVK